MKRLLALLLFPLGCLAQSGSPFTNALFPAQTFTATAQTGAVIQLNGQQLSYGAGTISLTGTALTTATFAVQGSSDNGLTYYALPITAVTPGASPSATATATASGLYQVSLVGITHLRFVTSGTFTGTSISLTLTATPNATVSRSSGGSVLIAPVQTLASPAATVTFSAIPQNYRYLKLFINGGGTTAASAQLNFNGDTVGTNYFNNTLTMSFANAVVATGAFSNAGAFVGSMNSFASGGGGADVTIYGYGSSLQKFYTAQGVGSNYQLNGGIWNSTAAIASIAITLSSGGGSWAAGSTFSLYGIN